MYSGWFYKESNCSKKGLWTLKNQVSNYKTPLKQGYNVVNHVFRVDAGRMKTEDPTHVALAKIQI